MRRKRRKKTVFVFSDSQSKNNHREAFRETLRALSLINVVFFLFILLMKVLLAKAVEANDFEAQVTFLI